MPTTPYGFSLEPITPDPDDAVTKFYITPEAIPLLPPRKDASRIAPISSLSPIALSAPPVAISEPPPAPSTGLPWGRVFLVLGAAVAAFVVTAAVARVTHPRRAVFSTPVELRPTTMPPVASEPSAPPSEVTSPVVVSEPVVIAARASARPSPKSRPRKLRAPAPAARPAAVAKRPFMPTEL